jgi:hypothetical protein
MVVIFVMIMYWRRSKLTGPTADISLNIVAAAAVVITLLPLIIIMTTIITTMKKKTDSQTKNFLILKLQYHLFCLHVHKIEISCQTHTGYLRN